MSACSADFMGLGNELVPQEHPGKKTEPKLITQPISNTGGRRVSYERCEGRGGGEGREREVERNERRWGELRGGRERREAKRGEGERNEGELREGIKK